MRRQRRQRRQRIKNIYIKNQYNKYEGCERRCVHAVYVYCVCVRVCINVFFFFFLLLFLHQSDVPTLHHGWQSCESAVLLRDVLTYFEVTVLAPQLQRRCMLLCSAKEHRASRVHVVSVKCFWIGKAFHYFNLPCKQCEHAAPT